MSDYAQERCVQAAAPGRRHRRCLGGAPLARRLHPGQRPRSARACPGAAAHPGRRTAPWRASCVPACQFASASQNSASSCAVHAPARQLRHALHGHAPHLGRHGITRRERHDARRGSSSRLPNHVLENDSTRFAHTRGRAGRDDDADASFFLRRDAGEEAVRRGVQRRREKHEEHAAKQRARACCAPARGHRGGASSVPGGAGCASRARRAPAMLSWARLCVPRSQIGPSEGTATTALHACAGRGVQQTRRDSRSVPIALRPARGGRAARPAPAAPQSSPRAPRPYPRPAVLRAPTTRNPRR